MPRCRLLIVIALFALVGTAACDSTPVDPQDPQSDIASLINRAGAALGDARAPLSLPALLHAAVDRVYREQGSSAARALVAPLRQLSQEAQQAVAAGDRETLALKVRALQLAELRIVLSVFGDAVAGRVAGAVRDDAERLHARLAGMQQNGDSMPRVAETLGRVGGLLADADAALTAGDPVAALDAATRAAGLADVARRALSDAVRLPGLEQLFERAAARLHASAGADRAAAQLAEYRRLQQLARQSVDGGSREAAHRALEAVRHEQVRIVLAVLGPQEVRTYLHRARGVADELAEGVAGAAAAGRDLPRLERMVESARDLLLRADQALADGRAGVALDLGSHAAGLLNAVRAAL